MVINPTMIQGGTLFPVTLSVATFRLLLLFSVLISCVSNASQWIDEDTKQDVHTIVRHHDGKVLNLVMSDEFNTGGRGFLPGEDNVWEAITAPDYTNAAIEFYNGTKEYVTTRDGNLVLTVRAEKTYWEEWNATSSTFIKNQMNYTSGKINRLSSFTLSYYTLLHYLSFIAYTRYNFDLLYLTIKLNFF